jgi:hypothetical protein
MSLRVGTPDQAVGSWGCVERYAHDHEHCRQAHHQVCQAQACSRVACRSWPHAQSSRLRIRTSGYLSIESATTIGTTARTTWLPV